MDKLGGKFGWKNRVHKLDAILCGKIVWTNCVKNVWKNWWENCTVYIVQCTLYIVHSAVYSVQCTVYNVCNSKVMLLSLWREPQCSSVWGVKLLARLLLCLTPQEDSRAVVGDLEMEWNLVVGDPEMEWNLVVGDLEMEWNFNPEKMKVWFPRIFCNLKIFFFTFSHKSQC